MSVKASKPARQEGWSVRLAEPFVRFGRYVRGLRANAPHQSFVLTRKRDKVKKPKLEGFIAFAVHVLVTLWRSKGLFLRFLSLYFVLAIVMVGIIQGSNLASVNEVINAVSEETSTVTEPLSQAFVVVTSSLGGALNANLSEIQQFYMIALYIFIALITIWLLRQRLAGKAVKVRDGLYSAGAPLIALYVMVIIAILQLLPFAILAIVYNVALSSGFLNGGIEAGLFGGGLFLAAVLTLYFLTTTLFAFMIVTIPGTYPLQAYKTAKKIVAGQRLRLLMRLLFLAVVIGLIWYVVLIPVALVAQAFGWQDSYLIPVFVQLVTGFCLIYGTAYTYLLYRRMIDDPVEG